jgi:hypothetical protein
LNETSACEFTCNIRYIYTGGVYILCRHKTYTYYSWCVGTFDNRQQMLESMFFIETFSRRNWAGNTHEHIWSLRDRSFNLKGVRIFFSPEFHITLLWQKLWIRFFFLEKKHNPSFKLNGRSLNDRDFEKKVWFPPPPFF